MQIKFVVGSGDLASPPVLSAIIVNSWLEGRGPLC